MGFTPGCLLHPNFSVGLQAARRGYISPGFSLVEMSSLLQTGHAAPSIVSGERRGTRPTVPVTRGSALLSRQHQEPKGFSCVSVPPAPAKFLQLGGKKTYVCTREIKDRRLSPWGRLSPSLGLNPNCLQNANVKVEPGQVGWELFVFYYYYFLHKPLNNPPMQMEKSARLGTGAGEAGDPIFYQNIES